MKLHYILFSISLICNNIVRASYYSDETPFKMNLQVSKYIGDQQITFLTITFGNNKERGPFVHYSTNPYKNALLETLIAYHFASKNPTFKPPLYTKMTLDFILTKYVADERALHIDPSLAVIFLEKIKHEGQSPFLNFLAHEFKDAIRYQEIERNLLQLLDSNSENKV